MLRKDGVLLPLFSLPSQQGIGCFGPECYRWIDRLEQLGIRYWQLCPLGPVGYGHSPYQSLAEGALNPLFIDVKDLINRGWLAKSKLQAFGNLSKTFVEYEKVNLVLTPLLYEAYEAFCKDSSSYQRFIEFYQTRQNDLEAYAIFSALKERFHNEPWWQWPSEYRRYQTSSVAAYASAHRRAVEFFAFLQWVLSEQWTRLHHYAHQHHVSIIGDLPIYVGEDSVSIWAHRELFQWDALSDRPQYVAGVPPDYFSSSGQLWGNPIYNWPEMEKNQFHWWIDRIEKNFNHFDLIRLDHFRGFYNYWAIPRNAPDARHGQWMPGPQHAFFQQLKKHFPTMPFILEDLGDLNKEVRDFQKSLNLPGMAILQFAFDGENNPYLPEHWTKDTIVYTGTHDNDTTRGWFEHAPESVKSACLKLLHPTSLKANTDDVVFDLIRLACKHPAPHMVIIPLQDWLKKGPQGRINTPSTVSNSNWTWRCTSEELATFSKNVIRVLNL